VDAFITNMIFFNRGHLNYQKAKLENYFQQFRDKIVGIDQTFPSLYGIQKIIYADWTASGRLYKPIEDKLLHEIGPFVANTHTETSFTGSAMTLAYHQARKVIKSHVNANNDDVLIICGTGMTGAINKFQRILGLKVSENLIEYTNIPQEVRPIVFISHMEHHSNQTSGSLFINFSVLSSAKAFNKLSVICCLYSSFFFAAISKKLIGVNYQYLFVSSSSKCN